MININEYPPLLIAGTFLILAIVFFYLWLRTEGKLKEERRR